MGMVAILTESVALAHLIDCQFQRAALQCR
jgi:hypothetical protein